MKLSVVVTTYNRADVLPKLIEAFDNQTEQEFEVIFAIDGSTDGTEEVLRELSPRCRVRWVNTYCTEYGLAVARNLGILAAAGRAVVVLDDDSFPNPNFVAAHCEGVKSKVISGGPRNPSNPSDVRMSWKMEQLSKLPALSPLTISELKQNWPKVYLIENNICLFREDWLAIGLFSERLKMYGYIGQEFFARAEYLGYRYQYNPDASIVHHSEFEGYNGISRKKKNREARLAALIRPSLERPVHFEAQISWAKSIAEGDKPKDFPPFYLGALLALPHRMAWQKMSFLKGALKK